MSKTVKFVIGVIIAIIAYGVGRYAAGLLGLGPLLASMAGGVVAVLAFFAAGKPLGYVTFKKR